jgi:ABC-type Fe3+-hydroxamate transport system substrate-binding protein
VKTATKRLDGAEALIGLEFDAELLDQLEAEPLFQRLPAVRNGDYHRLSIEECTELRFAGRVSGMEEQAEELIEDFDRRVDEAAGNLGDLGTTSVVSMFPGEVRLYSAESVVGGLVESLGARNVPELESLSVGEIRAGVVYGLSEEVIPDLQGETLILLQNPTSQEEMDYIAGLAKTELSGRASPP